MAKYNHLLSFLCILSLVSCYHTNHVCSHNHADNAYDKILVSPKKNVTIVDDNSGKIAGTYEYYTKEKYMNDGMVQSELHATCYINASDIDFYSLVGDKSFSCQIIYKGYINDADYCTIVWRRNGTGSVGAMCKDFQSRAGEPYT